MASLSWVASAADSKIQFNRDVRPILSDACFHCHGPDQKSRKAQLRLDLREEALKAGKSGAVAIIPGKPDESEVVKRLFTADPDDLMPPEEAHKTLTQKQKETLRRWIADGAEYQSHWAYTPLVRPAVPPMAGAQNAVDAFIRHRLAEQNLDLSPSAPPEALCRRLHLDLIGLPPAPDEVKKFAAAYQANAKAVVEAKINELIGNAHFGERWAVWWLDVARFTDTVGFHGDQNQRIFPYRDYVIDSFNKNKKFDAFTIEQLAGDLLPNATAEQKVASGFNRLNMMTREGGAQPKEYLAKYGAERTRTVGTAWLGATFACAECHDHKYDPITTRDFYSLQAFFADVKQWGVYSDYGYTPNPDLRGWSNDHPFPPEIEVESAYLKSRISQLKAKSDRLVAATSQVLSTDAVQKEKFVAWTGTALQWFGAHPTGWQSPAPSVSSSAPKKKKGKAAAKQPAPTPNPAASAEEEPPWQVQEDGTVVFDHGAADNTELRFKPAAGWIAAFRVELLACECHQGSILRNGKSDSASLKVSASLLKKGTPKPGAVGVAAADSATKEPRYANGADILGIRDVWRTSAAKAKEAQTGVFLLDRPILLAEGDEFIVQLNDNMAGAVRVSISPFAPPLGDGAWMDHLKASLQAAAAGPPIIVQQAFLTGTGWNREALKSVQNIAAEIAECRGGKAWTMVTEQMAPLAIRVLPRGNWMDESGAVVQPQVPHFLPQIANPESRRLTRLDLARWICSPENPVTGRTVMNRLWKQFFGNGLSAVVDDLGAQGEPPSHPELLDWLAVEFRESGWDFQHIVRLITTSAVYQQSSNLRPEVHEADPNNRLLSSQNPRRLDAEFVRDNALAISGLLVPDIGGPSVKPYQPPGYYESIQFPSRDYLPDKDDRSWRRGVYMHWQRTFLHPMLANFDAPMRDECAAARVLSNTPQQALTMLNDPVFTEAARVFAQRLLVTAGGDAGKLTTAFHLALSRSPKAAEAASLTAFLSEQRKYFQANGADAEKVAALGNAPHTAGVDPAELAAWANVCRVILNLHETITRY